jgi:HAE1 family hydrophobic/amphiphilic exporter-1
MAALMGTLPIALGFGAGAESRRALGVSVVGGLFFSQIVTLFLTPVVYIYLEKVRVWTRRVVVRRTGFDVAPAEAHRGSSAD